MAEVLHFAHGNGFPARVYAPMLDALGPAFEIHAVERFGHQTRFPVTRGWPHLVEELLEAVERRRHADGGRPAWLLGHSLGGFLSLMAVLRKPDWFAGVVTLDSPLIGGWRAWALRFGQVTGIDEYFSPAHATRTRRTSWPSLDAVAAHFSAKRAFADWHPDALRAYVEHGTRRVAGSAARELAFSREVEYAIYRNLPWDLGRRLRRGLPVPVAMVIGAQSREVRQCGLAASRRLVGGRLTVVPGGHLFPMAHPADTAAAVRAAIDSLRGD